MPLVASERKLGKKPVTKPKNSKKIKGTGLGLQGWPTARVSG